MGAIRAFLRILTGILFRLVVFVLPLVVAFTMVFGGPAALQSALKESGVHEAAPKAMLEQLEKDAKKAGASTDTGPLATKEAQEAVAKSIQSAEVEKNVNAVSGGIFSWLQGKTNQIDFTIDLTSTKETLVSNLGDLVEGQLSSLPACTTPQQLVQAGQKLQQQDLAGLQCLPPGFSPQAAGQLFGQQAVNQLELLKEPKLTADSLLRSEQGQGNAALGANSQIPEAYQLALKLPWVLGITALVLAVAVVLLHTRRRRGIQIIGLALLVSGILHLIASLVALAVFKSINLSVIEGSDVPVELELALTKAFAILLSDYAKIVAIIAAIYTVSGFAIVVGEIKTRAKPVIMPPQQSVTSPDTELPRVMGTLPDPEAPKDNQNTEIKQ